MRAIYITPQRDEITDQDLARMAHLPVDCIVLAYREKTSVQQAVHMLSHRSVKLLLLPDDYHRHNELIEHTKACAYHMGIEVQPVTRYITKYPPAPAQHHPVHASSETAGVGGGIPAQAEPG